MIKIVLYGPESTGKTTLAADLARRLNTLWVPEFARGYLDEKRAYYDPFGRTSDEVCQPQDIPHIVVGQIVLEDAMEKQANRFLICDTNLLQTRVYNFYYYNRIDAWLESSIQQRPYDLYLLTDIDVPWEDDPLRDITANRKKLFDLFRKELTDRNFPYTILSGSHEQRLEQALHHLKRLG